MLQSIIIDAEEDARSSLALLIERHCPDVEIIGTAEGVQTGASLIQELNPQIIFLNIKMKDGTGFQLLDQFPNHSFKVIFITAFNNFAIKAFQYGAIAYLLKPIDPEELIQAINQANQSNQKKFDKLTLLTSKRLVSVKIKDIIYLQSEGNHTFFFTVNDEKIVVRKTIETYEKLLPAENFHRVSPSYVVNMNFVKTYRKQDGGILLLINGEKISLSKPKK